MTCCSAIPIGITFRGLPFFQPAYRKDAKLTIYGSSQKYKEHFLTSILKDQMDYEYFPVAISAFEADIRIQVISEETLHFGPITVDWQEQLYRP